MPIGYLCMPRRKQTPAPKVVLTSRPMLGVWKITEAKQITGYPFEKDGEKMFGRFKFHVVKIKLQHEQAPHRPVNLIFSDNKGIPKYTITNGYGVKTVMTKSDFRRYAEAKYGRTFYEKILSTIAAEIE